MSCFRALAIALALLTQAAISGCGAPSFLITPVENSGELKEEVVQPATAWTSDKIAIIEVEGLLSNSKHGGLLQPTENALSLFTQQLELVEKDNHVKAVVLRVNSPGGTVTASDGMYEMLLRFRKKTSKPVVASIQEVGASGAYYLSCGADKIIAQPTSIVGSIGVIFETIEFSGTLDKIGAKSNAITSGPLKAMGSPFKPLEAREAKVMSDMVNEYFSRFVGVVRSNRQVVEALPPGGDLSEYAKQTYGGVFSGRVFSGAEAKKLGLIDDTGLLVDAIDLARSMGKASGAAAVMYRRPYGYSGSIYASSTISSPGASVTTLEIPGASAFVPAGFYYLWRPGL